VHFPDIVADLVPGHPLDPHLERIGVDARKGDIVDLRWSNAGSGQDRVDGLFGYSVSFFTRVKRSSEAQARTAPSLMIAAVALWSSLMLI